MTASFVQKVLSDKSEPKSNETLKFKVARVLLTGIINNQYYRTESEIIKEATESLLECAKTDPSYLLKAVGFARNLNMKGMVKVALCCLAGSASDDFLNDINNRKNIIATLSTFHPKQLVQFIELQKSKKFGRGLGSRPQKWVEAVMKGWNESKLENYSVKYRSDMKVLLRLIHPSYNTNLGNVAKFCLDSSEKFPNNGKAFGETQKAFERLKLETDPCAIAKLMVDHNIPWDAVKGVHAGYNSGIIGIATMAQMGLTALLLNVASFEKTGLLATEDGFNVFSAKLDEVKNGRSLPIDFAKPYLHIDSQKVKNKLIEAIITSLEISMPEIENRRIGLSIDVSGSMSDGNNLPTSGLLSIPFLKSKELWFTTFDTQLYEEGTNGFCPRLTGESIKDKVKSLLSLTAHGGTNIGSSVQKAINSNRKLDLHIIITDEQQNAGTPLMTVWKQYRKQINPEAELWILNATNNTWHSCDFKDPSVTVYQSLTPAIFRNLQFCGQDLISAIESYKF